MLLALSLAATVMNHSQPTFITQLQTIITSDPSQAEKLIRSKFKPEDLAVGISPYKESTTVLFAIDSPSKATVQGDNIETNELQTVGNLQLKIVKLRNCQGTSIQYIIDRKPTAKSYNLEVYDYTPTCDTPPGGRKGELRDMGELKCTTYPNTTRHWFIYLPPNLDPNIAYPVLCGTDAQWDRQWQANALENAARENLIPPTVGIFIEPGQDKPGNYSNRSYEYDRLTPDYSNFLLMEIFPVVEKIVKLSPSPADRATVGISSGGICGFTSCWERPDQFSTVISGVGSFTNIARGESNREGGHNYPFLIRLTEPKPIRAFLQDGTHDLDNQFGNWYLGNAQMSAALKFKNYDVQWFPGEGFHSSEHLRSVFDKALVWWNGKK
ncbi:MAG: alpha/beta hydrolase [Fimbriimonadaceae bacterium]